MVIHLSWNDSEPTCGTDATLLQWFSTPMKKLHRHDTAYVQGAWFICKINPAQFSLNEEATRIVDYPTPALSRRSDHSAF
jgi:hypothetical protein